MVILGALPFSIFDTYGQPPIRAFILLLVGIGLFIIVCMGVPWIASAVDKKPTTDKKQNVN